MTALKGTRGATVTNPLTGTPTRVGVTSVLVCDARSQSRAALTRTVSAIPTVTHIDSVTDDAGLLAAFAAYPAELVLIVVHRSHPSSTRAVDRLVDRYPHAAVLVYGSGQDTAALTAALAHGARRLMLWSAHPARTTAACSTSPVAARGPADRDAWPTERELQILRGISRGQTYAAIGRDLLLCEDTIKALSRQTVGVRLLCVVLARSGPVGGACTSRPSACQPGGAVGAGGPHPTVTEGFDMRVFGAPQRPAAGGSGR